MLQQYCNHSRQCRNNVATLCCTKSRRCESSRVTEHHLYIQKQGRNHRLYQCEQKPCPVWFSRRRKSYPVLIVMWTLKRIKAKLTPSAGQVESDAVTFMRENASEFMSFGHSIPIYSHFKTDFTAFKKLFHAGANHVELFPAASRRKAMVVRGGWFVSTISICCSSSISVCRKERQTVIDLY